MYSITNSAQQRLYEVCLTCQGSADLPDGDESRAAHTEPLAWCWLFIPTFVYLKTFMKIDSLQIFLMKELEAVRIVKNNK